MDNFRTQSGELHLREGHEESDLSVRGIVMFLMSLAVAGFASFLIVFAFFKYLQHLDKESQPPMTAVEQQLNTQREATEETAGKTPLPAGEAASVKPLPDYYGRGKIDEHLARTFPGPRLQYDDVYDMDLFRSSEERWLSSTGRNPDGSVHIPINQAMDLLVQHGLPQVSGPFVPPMLPTAVPMVPAGPSRR
jgi:hypothetical protein